MGLASTAWTWGDSSSFHTACSLDFERTKPYQEYVATETSLTAGSGRGLKDQFRDFRVYFSEWKHAKVLFGTCACWFLL
jgi:PHS family inorganic phosphate transporter-like MFS transporter